MTVSESEQRKPRVALFVLCCIALIALLSLVWQKYTQPMIVVGSLIMLMHLSGLWLPAAKRVKALKVLIILAMGVACAVQMCIAVSLVYLPVPFTISLLSHFFLGSQSPFFDGPAKKGQ